MAFQSNVCLGNGVCHGIFEGKTQFDTDMFHNQKQE